MHVDALICGAGIAGVAAAEALAARGARVALADERPPLSLTSDKSTECYRNWWPGPGDAMVALMSRSITLLEQLADATGNAFLLNRRGYLYVTCDPGRVGLLRAAAEEAAALGAGPLRVHPPGGAGEAYLPAPAHGYVGQPDGADLILDPALIRRHFPYLSGQAVALLHARRCGWLSAQQLGMLLLDRARAAGAQLLQARVTGVELQGGRVAAARLEGAAPSRVTCGAFVNAAGPLLRDVGRLAGVELPVFSERHLKLAFEDRLGAVPRDAPMLICADPLALPWSPEEQVLLAEDGAAHLLGALPPGAHLRPEGGAGSSWVLGLWAYDAAPVPEVFPPPIEPHFPEVVLRGLAELLPGLRPYLERPPRPLLDGGYYTKTRENRPLIGPAGAPGSFVLGALSGYGIMAAPAAAELLAAHVAAGPLPPYAAAFHPGRYDDAAYRALLDSWPESGQL